MNDAEIYRPLLLIARSSIENRLRTISFELPLLAPPLEKTRGVFVTLYAPGHELRGCIGHIQGVCGSLAEEVAECAVAAAFHDPRFPPVHLEELDSLSVEISLLGAVEPVESKADLDPKRYGVVVTSGFRRGLLLPDLEGVDTVEMQVDIAKRKAGVRPSDVVALSRFVVEKIREV